MLAIMPTWTLATLLILILASLRSSRAGVTESTGKADTGGSTGNIGSTESTGNTGSTGSTENTGNTGNTGNTESTGSTEGDTRSTEFTRTSMPILAGVLSRSVCKYKVHFFLLSVEQNSHSSILPAAPSPAGSDVLLTLLLLTLLSVPSRRMFPPHHRLLRGILAKMVMICWPVMSGAHWFIPGTFCSLLLKFAL